MICPDCNEIFSKEKNFIQHKNKVHNIIINCQLCIRKNFINDETRMDHLKSHKVRISSQLLILVIGFVVPFVWLYPFSKICKTIYGVLIMLGLPILGFLSSMYLLNGTTSSSYVFGSCYLLMIILSLYFLSGWSKKWNKKVDVQIGLLSNEAI